MKTEPQRDLGRERTRMKPIWILTILALMGAGAGAHAAGPTVHIETGWVEGSTTQGVTTFKGIPYAAPPIGARRWRAPAPAASWPKVRPAIEFGAACPQDPKVSGNPQPQSEDCLFLNIWQPSRPHKNAPVLVWIHGGGDVGGAGSQYPYDGMAFARDGVVSVTINYRLGALGYFAHPALWSEPGRKDKDGNYGLMDQIAALKWVQRNIASFGGDPRKVTLAGQSAGGEAVLYLMTVARAKGLYARAIAQSAPAYMQVKTLRDAEARDVSLLQAAGLPRTITAGELRALAPERFFGDYAAAGPYIDNDLIVAAPLDVFAAGEESPAPLLIGSVGDEGSLMAAYPKAIDQIIEALADRGRAVRAAYDRQMTEATFRRELFGDAIFGAPLRSIAAHHARIAPTYLYRFEYVTPQLREQRPGAWHVSDVLYAFDTIAKWRLAPTSEDVAMAKLVHACWVGFVKGGPVNCPPGHTWPPYDPRTDETLVFGDEGIRPVQHVRKSEYDAVKDALHLP